MNPFLQNPSNSQNYNRYSYCLNNPLKYVDPSGHVFLDPWYEYMAGPKTFRTWLREDVAEYNDDAGRKWKNIGNNINLMDFINPNKSVFLMKLKEDTEFDGYIKMLKEKYPDLKLDEDMVWRFNGKREDNTTKEEGLTNNSNKTIYYKPDNNNDWDAIPLKPGASTSTSVDAININGKVYKLRDGYNSLSVNQLNKVIFDYPWYTPAWPRVEVKDENWLNERLFNPDGSFKYYEWPTNSGSFVRDTQWWNIFNPNNQIPDPRK